MLFYTYWTSILRFNDGSVAGAILYLLRSWQSKEILNMLNLGLVRRVEKKMPFSSFVKREKSLIFSWNCSSPRTFSKSILSKMCNKKFVSTLLGPESFSKIDMYLSSGD